MERKPVLVVHGGAWDIPDREVRNHHKGIHNALDIGWGESIMKVMLAREVAERMRSGNVAQDAADSGIDLLEKRVQGLGGVICLDAKGHIGIQYNSPRMARGFFEEGMKKPLVSV